MKTTTSTITVPLFLCILLFAGWTPQAMALICTSLSSGNWNVAARWSCGRVPVTGDAVVISSGITVTLDVDSNTLGSLTINSGGILTIGAGNSFDIYLGGNLVNNGSINFNVSSSTNTIYLAGNNVTSTFSGSGTWNLDNLDLNGRTSTSKPCTGACKVEISGSPNLQFLSTSLFSGNSSTFTFNAGGNSTATVTLNRAGTQTIAAIGTTYPNLRLSGSNVKTAGTANGQTITVLGSLTIDSGVTLSETSRNPTVTVGGSVSNSGTYTAGTGAHTFSGSFTNTGTYTGSSGSVALAGNFSNSGTFTSSTGTWTFNGSSAQTLTGATTFTNMRMNNSSGLTINNNVTVSTLLTLTSGVITTGSNTLITSANCNAPAVSRTSGHIAGNLQKRIPTGTPVSCTFEIGDATTYRPINTTFASVATAGNVTGWSSQSAADHPDTTNLLSGIDPLLSVNRYWTLTNSGTVFTTCSATFNFVAGDIDAGALYTSFIVALGSSCSGSGATRTCTSWTQPTVGTLGATSTQATGLTAFGDFAIGQARNPNFSREPQFIYTRELY